MEAVGNTGERTEEFSFTPDLDRHVWIRKSLAEDQRAGERGCRYILELAAMGTATEVTAGAMIVAGAAAGAALFLAGWGLYQVLTTPNKKS